MAFKRRQSHEMPFYGHRIPRETPGIQHALDAENQNEVRKRRDEASLRFQKRWEKRSIKASMQAKAQAEKAVAEYKRQLRGAIVYRKENFLTRTERNNFINRIVRTLVNAYEKRAKGNPSESPVAYHNKKIKVANDRLTRLEQQRILATRRGNQDKLATILEEILGVQNEIKALALASRGDTQSEYQQRAFSNPSQFKSSINMLLDTQSVRSIGLLRSKLHPIPGRVNEIELSEPILCIRFEPDIWLHYEATGDEEHAPEEECYEINFGKFEFQCPISSLVLGDTLMARLRPYQSEAIIHCDDPVYHPHARHCETCWGEAKLPMKNAMVRGDLLSIVDIAMGHLTTYNESSPFCHIYDWEYERQKYLPEFTCQFCDEVRERGERIRGFDGVEGCEGCMVSIPWCGGRSSPERAHYIDELDETIVCDDLNQIIAVVFEYKDGRIEYDKLRYVGYVNDCWVTYATDYDFFAMNVEQYRRQCTVDENLPKLIENIEEAIINSHEPGETFGNYFIPSEEGEAVTA